jgi:hypothetical protein
MTTSSISPAPRNNHPANSSADLTTPTTPTPRKRRRWLFIVGGVVAVLAGGIAILYFYDESPPNDSDLLAPNSVAAADFVPVFPDENTARQPKSPRPEPNSNETREHLLYFGDLVVVDNFASVSKIKKSSISSEKIFNDLSYDIHQNGVNEKNIVVAREILEANSKALEAARKILRNFDLHTPPVKNPTVWTLYPEVSDLRVFIQTTLLQVQVLQFDGKTNEAFQLEKSILEFLLRLPVRDREEGLTSGLSQIAALDSNIANTAPILFPHLNKEQCDSLANALLKMENFWDADSLKMILRTEYTMLRNLFKNRTVAKNITNETMFAPFLFKPNWLLRRAGNKYRAAILALNEDPVFLPESSSRWDSFFDLFLPIWASTAIDPYIEPAYRFVLEHRARIRAFRVALAAHAYSLDNGGNLPPELGVLVPKYLPALPSDPFSKEKAALRYDAKQGLIWSIGGNFKDEGGKGIYNRKSTQGEPDGDDVAFKIPVLPARS